VKALRATEREREREREREQTAVAHGLVVCRSRACVSVTETAAELRDVAVRYE